MPRNDDYPRTFEHFSAPQFPHPQLDSCERTDCQVLYENGQLVTHQNAVLVKTGELTTFDNAGGFNDDTRMHDTEARVESQPPERAYLLLNTIADAIHGKSAGYAFISTISTCIYYFIKHNDKNTK